MATSQRSTLLLLFLSLLFDLLAFTIILPLLPSILDHYGEQSRDPAYDGLIRLTSSFRKLANIPDTPKHNSILLGGILGSLFSLLQFLSSPLLGSLSDIYGRKPMLIVTMLGSGLSYLIWAGASSFSLFLVARIVGGLSKGNVGIVMAVVSDISDEQSRGRGMALVGIAFSLGFLLGPSLGAYFSVRMRLDSAAFFTVPALVSFALLVVGLVFVLLLPESLPSSKRARFAVGHLRRECFQLINPLSIISFSPLRKSPGHHRMVPLGVVLFLYLFIYSGLEFTLTFLVHQSFGYTSMDQGRMFFFLGSLMILFQGGYVRRIAPERRRRTVILGLCALVPAFVLIGVGTSPIVFYFGLFLFSFASAVVVPLLTTLVSLCGSAKHQGQILGIFRSIGAFARALGPCVASAGIWLAGSKATYMIGAISVLIPLVIFAKRIH